MPAPRPLFNWLRLSLGLTGGVIVTLTVLAALPGGGGILIGLPLGLLGLAQVAHVGLRLNRQAREQVDLAERQREHQADLDRYMDRLREVVGQIEAGDLTVNPTEHLAGGHTHLAEALQRMVQTYAAIFTKFQRTSAEVSNNAHHILETSGDQASGSSEQAAAVAEITSAMEELARTAAQIAGNAAHVVACSEGTESSAAEGMAQMRRNTASLERMNERMGDINGNAHRLGEKFQEIDKILTLITSIASETHVLALNAAIEAASAGEFGARFSVIASEVRRLSDMSQNSVEEIKRILGDFQRSIQSTILATEQGTKEFESAMESAFVIQEKLDGIGARAGETTQAAKEISLATQQQKTASDQIVETLKDVSVVIRQIANALKEFNKSANRLDALSMEMQLIPQNFTLPSDRNVKHIVKRAVQRPDISGFRRQDATMALADILQQYPFIELIFIGDSEGTLCQYAASPTIDGERVKEVLPIGSACSSRPWYYAAVESRRAHLTPMYKSLLTGENCFTISAPILDAQGTLLGVLGVDINASIWSKI